MPSGKVLGTAVLAAAIVAAQPTRAQNVFEFLIPKTVCFIYSASAPPATFVGPDNKPIPLTKQQCDRVNADAQQQEVEDAQQAEQQREAEAQRAAAAQAQKRQQEHFNAAKVAALLDEERGYKRVTMNDLLLDQKDYAANGTGVAVAGFYKLQGRRDERLYISYDDFMMHTFQSVEARYIGLITDNAARPLREYLMRCGNGAGCNVTILGHVQQCTDTNAFGTMAEDLCLVADDMGAQAD